MVYINTLYDIYIYIQIYIYISLDHSGILNKLLMAIQRNEPSNETELQVNP